VNKQEIVLPMLRAEAIQARSLEVILFSICNSGLAGEVQPKTAPYENAPRAPFENHLF
jgi:hypothetical protein